jgi:hypothetical protein
VRTCGRLNVTVQDGELALSLLLETMSLQTLVNRLSRAELESVVSQLGIEFPTQTESIVKAHLPEYKRSELIASVKIPLSGLRSKKMGEHS